MYLPVKSSPRTAGMGYFRPVSAQLEEAEFYPPPYDFLAPLGWPVKRGLGASCEPFCGAIMNRSDAEARGAHPGNTTVPYWDAPNVGKGGSLPYWLFDGGKMPLPGENAAKGLPNPPNALELTHNLFSSRTSSPAAAPPRKLSPVTIAPPMPAAGWRPHVAPVHGMAGFTDTLMADSVITGVPNWALGAAGLAAVLFFGSRSGKKDALRKARSKYESEISSINKEYSVSGRARRAARRIPRVKVVTA